MFKSSKIIIIAVLVIIVALSFGVGFITGERNLPVKATGLDVVDQAWNYLLSDYVDQTKLDSENMTRAAIEGIVNTLNDPYTTYLTKSQLNEFLTGIQGKYAGIGAVVTSQDEKIMIVNVFPGSPAEKAGLKSGDTILEINSEIATGLNLDVAVGKIRGPADTTVTLLILHQNETEPVTIEITRANVELPSVYYKMQGDIACIFLLQFTERTENELATIMKQLKEANPKGIVLDLRGNPGGLLDIAVQVASNFIPKGIIVKIRSKDGSIETREAVSGLETTDLPMVALVNQFSASGAEVLTGALQDHQRALIAGNTTYGKGSVNMPIQLNDGSGLYITIARWLTPHDRLIEGQGIDPDVKLDLTWDAELQWAIDYLSGKSSQ
ncbi:MAG: S41 family peptidase [Dehalococcoidales bacterium]